MGLDIPDLDTNRYDRLMREALAKLPSFSGEWSDFNTSDPGVTILELLAWFADIDSYRFDRIDERERRAFLKLVGIEPKPAKPASVLLHFESGGGTTLIGKGTKLFGNGLPFRTEQELNLSGAKVESIVTSGFGDDITALHMPFYPFGTFLREGFYFILKLSEPVGGKVRIYFRVRKMGLETDGSDSLSWRFCNKAADCTKPPSEWGKAVIVEESTKGLRQSGFIEFSLPAGTSKIACILQKKGGYENLPLIEAIVPDSVFASQLEEVDRELGLSSGYVNQSFSLEEGLDPESLEVKVGQKVWRRVKHLESFGPDDEVYTLAGATLRFGDGGYGKIPPYGEKIVCSYLKSDGSKGNIGKKASWRVVDGAGKYSVENPFEAVGGEDAEGLDALFASFSRNLKDIKRAVTAEDHEELALKTPDTVLARAVADVDRRRNRITLTLIPESEIKRPMPSDATLEKVYRFLEQRRLLTTKISVAKPLYAEVSVSVVVRSRSFDEKGVKERIVKRLDEFLHPLYGGRGKSGWIDTKSLYISQLYLELSSIGQIASIEGMSVTMRYPDGRIVRKSDGKIEVPAGVIFSSGRHTVRLTLPAVGECGRKV